MDTQLSSNWKKLQAQIKSEGAAKQPLATAKTTAAPIKTTTVASTGHKRRRSEGDDADTKTTRKKPALASGRQRAEPRSRTVSAAAMGVTQSSQIDREDVQWSTTATGRVREGRAAAAAARPSVSPSLALWAADHDISPETLAQAYGLGPGLAGPGGRSADRETLAVAMDAAARDDRENGGRTAGLEVGKYVALDCEMVGVVVKDAEAAAGERRQQRRLHEQQDGHIDDAVARVSMVDFFGRQVYDSYVRPQTGQRVVDWRTHVSGVTAKHMHHARPFDEVRAEVLALLRGGSKDNDDGGSPRILVGHDVRHDLRVLDLASLHPPALIRDTAKFSGFKAYGHGPKPALRVLARALLGVEIQQGAHSSVVDARVAMQLFRLRKSAFDVECANRFGTATPLSRPASSKKQKQKRKKKKS